MLHCARCAEALPASVRFCPSCGEPVGALSQMATMDSPPAQSPARGHTPPPLSDSGSLGELGFAPGQTFAERYRILALLGKGGMGEVYRADDLKLGQPVALKFLSLKLAQDSDLRQRFYVEVRLARQVSHPNVCRVYDVGESDGRHYLSMEYVDGEDLASLLKRIGRLPSDKALHVARELCAGLAAAHERGVLHRDLKPANVMLDGRGHARITDFGLAIPLETGTSERGRVGTPTYMAPEQLTGGAVTARTDLYALGLILYEVFTGKRPFEAKTVGERLRLMEASRPDSVTGIAGTDPAVERAILRCLEKEPQQRPPSALAVAAALPGGDPLAAALAAGETPSPEMVAAAGEQGALKPSVALAGFAAVLAGLFLAAAMGPRTMLLQQVPLDKPPELLAERAREIIRSAGYTDRPADTAFYFTYDAEYLRHIERNDKSKDRWKALARGQPAAARLVYRQSPRPLITTTPSQRVLAEDPPFTVSGMVNVVVDTEGRLLSFRAVPAQFAAASEPAGEPDWAPLFAAAGLEPARFKAAAPQWTQVVPSDRLVAWEGVFPEKPEIPLRVEAGSHRGKPVLFALVPPWTRPTRMGGAPVTLQTRVNNLTFAVTLVAVILGGVFLTRRNIVLGRGDRSGAFKAAAFAFVMELLRWVFRADHAPEPAAEVELFQLAAGQALFYAALVWLNYMALEPYVRRRWPWMLISWNRLLAGKLRDPLVGRDILLGSLLGVASSMIFPLAIAAPAWFGVPGPAPAIVTISFSEARLQVANFFWDLGRAVGANLYLLCLLLLLRVLLRKQWLAVPAVAGVLSVFIAGTTPASGIEWAAAGLAAAMYVAVLLRFGMFPSTVMIFFIFFLRNSPLTLDISAWYAPRAAAALLALAAIAGYGFYTSIGAQKLLAGTLLEEES